MNNPLGGGPKEIFRRAFLQPQIEEAGKSLNRKTCYVSLIGNNPGSYIEGYVEAILNAAKLEGDRYRLQRLLEAREARIYLAVGWTIASGLVGLAVGM